MTPYPSKTQVTKAGDVIRRSRNHPDDVDVFELRAAYDVVTAFRATWARPPQPLAKIAMGLRSMVHSTTGEKFRPSQRLKRLDRIIEKLLRPEHSSMRLPQMEDIGGCRVVVPTLDELQRLRARVLENWGDEVRSTHDYVAQRKTDGYRSIHIIVERDEHLVEIQLRTRRQHLWAVHVERLEMSRQEVLRGGEGRDVTRDALLGFSDALFLTDSGHEIPAELRANLEIWLEELEDRK